MYIVLSNKGQSHLGLAKMLFEVRGSRVGSAMVPLLFRALLSIV